MVSEGPRRSGRVRKPIQTYAEEQAAENALALSLPTVKRRKKNPRLSNNDDADAAVMEQPANITADRAEKSVTQVKKVEGFDDGDDGDTTEISQPVKMRGMQALKYAPDWHADAAERRVAREQGQVDRLHNGAPEKRLRPFVDEPDQKFTKAFNAATTQRMYVIDRERSAEPNCHAHHADCPREKIQLAGSTGNVYTVTISHLPSCTCPVGLFQVKGNRSCCKHVLYVLHHVLKAPVESKQQNALLTSELRDIFAASPALASEVADDEPMDGNRKALSDDCPICFTEFDEGEDVTWCRAACGNNIHNACFEQWERAKPGKVTCPFCRAPWQKEDAVKSQKATVTNITVPEDRKAGGYRNVRHLLDYDE